LESRPRVRPLCSSRHWWLLVVLGLLGTPYLAEAHSPQKPKHRWLAADTTQLRRPQVLPLHLTQKELLSTEYLRRALQQSQKRADEGSPAQRYAVRYRIPLELAQQILDISRAEGLDPELAFRLVRTESRFHTRARGPAGALGLTQLMPSTARSMDPSLRTEAAVLEPATNLRLGFRYMRMMIDKFGGDVRLGLLAYNRGETAVKRALKRGVDPENGYSRKVLGTHNGSAYKGNGVAPQ
jgi:soluble lytic murein transglycosylase-like protein